MCWLALKYQLQSSKWQAATLEGQVIAPGEQGQCHPLVFLMRAHHAAKTAFSVVLGGLQKPCLLRVP